MKSAKSIIFSIVMTAAMIICMMPFANQSVYADNETVKITLHASSIEGDDWVDPIVIEVPKGTSYGDALTSYGNEHPEMNAEWAVNRSPFKKEGYGPIHIYYDNLHHTKSFTESTAYRENRIQAADIINNDIDVYVWHDIVLNRITIKRPICGTEVSHTSDPYADQINAPQLIYSDKIVPEYEKPAVWIQGPDNAGEAFQGTIEGGKTYYAYVILRLKSDIGYQFDYVTGKMTVNGGKLEQWRMLNGSKIIFVASTEASHIWGETKYSWGKNDSTVTASRPCTVEGCEGVDSETEDVVVTEKAATCTEDGVKTYTAEFANPDFKKQVKTVKTEEAHGHSEVTMPAVAATCTQGGKTAGKKCPDCGKIFVAQKDTAALGHKEVTIPGVAATCTEGGKTAGKRCTVCNEITLAQKDIAALGHKEETMPAVATTCTKAGKTAGSKCSRCGEVFVEQKDIPAHGHKEVTIPAVAATCTQGGKTAGKKCSTCGTILVAQKSIAALGHKWDAGKVTKAATTAATGVKTYTCTRCKATKTESIAKLPQPAKKILVAKAIANGSTAADISWNNISVDRYTVYMAQCNSKGKTYKYKKLKTVNGKTYKYKASKLSKNTFYRVYVVAEKKSGKTYKKLATSSVAYFTSGNVSGSYTNPKTLTLKKSSITLAKGKSYKLSGTVTKVYPKKKLAGYAKNMRFISNNTAIATVDANGKITAKSKGSCTIYVQTINGIWKTCKITVN